MKRIHLFEFEDFDWLPKTVKSGMTNLLVVLHKMLGTKEVLNNLILAAKSKYAFNDIVDLGSGSGGIMSPISDNLYQNHGVKMTLSDLNPDPKFVDYFNQHSNEGISYLEKPVDATNFAEIKGGLKTMVNSFHHMPPKVARQILHSAQDNREAILIYEIGENKVPLVIWWLLLPLSLVILMLMSLFMTPFVRPLKFSQLFFTYIIPVIPLLYAWDGQVSSVRFYTFSDIEKLLGDRINDASYKWEMGKAAKSNGKSVGYYLLGYPVETN